MSKYLPFFLLLLSISCTETIEIENFNKEKWIHDVDGCNKERKALVAIIMQQKHTLQGKDQAQIKDLLGKPDIHELYRRSQRFFMYSIDPGVSCKEFIADKTAANLTLRFNALGRVHEIIYYK